MTSIALLIIRNKRVCVSGVVLWRVVYITARAYFVIELFFIRKWCLGVGTIVNLSVHMMGLCTGIVPCNGNVTSW